MVGGVKPDWAWPAHKRLPFGTVPWASETASIEAARPPDSASPKREKRQRWSLPSSVCGNRTWLAWYICKISVKTVKALIPALNSNPKKLTVRQRREKPSEFTLSYASNILV